MNNPSFHTNTYYLTAEKRALEYYHTLCVLVKNQVYIEKLTKDLHEWKQNYLPKTRIFPKIVNEKQPKDFRQYVRWLAKKGKLDDYLHRSVAYIFMRDLGKDPQSVQTKTRINEIVIQIKKYITTVNFEKLEANEIVSYAKMFRLAEKEGLESTFSWLITKLTKIFSIIPKELDSLHAKRKLLKIIVGVVLHQIELFHEQKNDHNRQEKLDEAIRLGYAYGLTYPFIDDLLDSGLLTSDEKEQYANLIRTTFETGNVPTFHEWNGPNKNFIKTIHEELVEAFHYIKSKQNLMKSFLGDTLTFFHSQEIDRKKDLANCNYKNEEIFIPIIIKAASSRSIIRTIINAPLDQRTIDRFFYYGLYNQLADDFTDMDEDISNNRVTPYTYYLKHHKNRNDLINPFELYFAVITYLIHQVYHSDKSIRELILNRVVNGLKRFKNRVGSKKYKEVLQVYATNDNEFNKLIDTLVKKTTDVGYLDKWLRDDLISRLKKTEEAESDLFSKIEKAREKINKIIPIKEADFSNGDLIHEAANYSLIGTGKRLRPIITLMMARELKLNEESIAPLLRSLEYMHTASLIFDDLPSQDNSNLRRGLPTLHERNSVAIAELTGLYLTQKAVENQASLHQFNPQSVLKLIQYSAHVTGKMCKGQVIDLSSRNRRLTLEELNLLAYYKTGIGFEACLIMPAILAKANEAEIAAFKQYAYHAGIAFQIRDDLLDTDGNSSLIGKPSGIDEKQKQSTFVTTLGYEKATTVMWQHYCSAIESVEKLTCNLTFLQYLVNYMITRNK